MAKMKCNACEHEFKSKTKRPMCPQGCTLDRSEVIYPGDFSTVSRIAGRYESEIKAEEDKVKAEKAEAAAKKAEEDKARSEKAAADKKKADADAKAAADKKKADAASDKKDVDSTPAF